MSNVTPFPNSGTRHAPASTPELTHAEMELLLHDLQGESGAEIDRMCADHNTAARANLRPVEEAENEPYCNECGSDKLAFEESYANGDA